MATERRAEPSALLPRQVSIVERFHCVLYPFDLLILFDSLPSHGWVVSEAAEEADDVRRVRVPVKGNNRLRIDQGNKTLGVGGKDIVEVLSGYREIRDVARAVSPLSSEVSTHYVELRYMGIISSPDSAQAFDRFWDTNGQMALLSEELAARLPSDNRMRPVGVRLATQASDANRPNWAELSIVPVTSSGNVGYQFDLIYRNQNSETVEGVTEQAEETIRHAVSRVEGR